MHYGSILLNFAARSPSRADATENGVLRAANEPDRSAIPAQNGGLGERSPWPSQSLSVMYRST